MHIGFEAKRLFKNYTGLGNYSRFVVNALTDFNASNHYYLFTPILKNHPEVNSIISKSNVSVITPPNHYPSIFKSIWRTWGISGEEKTQNLDIFHGLSQELPIGLPKNVRKVVTVHDLIYLRYPEFYSFIDVRIYTMKVKFACKKADVVIAISQQTADDLVEFLKVDRSKIRIVYQGCHPIFKKNSSEEERQKVKRKYGLPEKFLLNVGTIEVRKNALLIVKALARIPENLRIPLVIVGKRTSYVDLIQQFIDNSGLQEWVKFIHNADFGDFPSIYQASEIFIYPSLFEGFGIPIVEAIESGVPVITSKGSAFTEAAGTHSMFVNSMDEEELAEVIKKILDDSSLRDKMILNSRSYIERFQPQVIAQDLSRLYESIL